MTIDVQLLTTIVDASIFLLAALRLHNVETEQSEFVLYLTMVFGFGWLLLSHLDSWASWIDWGGVYIMVVPSRGLVTRCALLVGLIYVNWRGESRHKCPSPKTELGKTIDKLS